MPPVKSYAQAAWMKHNKPAMYARWVREHGEPENLPMRVGKKSTRRRWRKRTTHKEKT